MTGPLVGRTVLLLEADSFLAGYVGAALTAAGARLIGPVNAIVDARTVMAGQRVDAAIVGISAGATAEWAFSDELETHGIRVIITCAASIEIPKHRRSAPCLKKAFAAYQVVEMVAAQLPSGSTDVLEYRRVAHDRPS